MNDEEFRQLLITRVEALRTEAALPRLRFYQQIGPVAACKWTDFVSASPEDAWKHFSLKAVEKICDLFGVGAELFQPDRPH
jgi:hypothetical protein